MIEIINKIDLPILLILFIIICILLSDKKEGFKGINGTYAYITSMFRTRGESSYHSLGIALDFQFFKKNGTIIRNQEEDINNLKMAFSFKENPALKWLYNHAYEYGFTQPNWANDGRGAVNSDGEEWWHWEYHGTSAICMLRKQPIPTLGGNSQSDNPLDQIKESKIKTFVKNPKKPDGSESVYVGCGYSKISYSDARVISATESEARKNMKVDKLDPGFQPTTVKAIIKNGNYGGITISDWKNDWIAIASNYVAKKEATSVFKAKSSNDEGKQRAGYGTDKILENGRLSDVTTSTVFTLQTANNTLIYQIKDFANTIKNELGSSNWDKLNKYQKAAIVSIGYNAGENFISERNYGKKIKQGISNNDFKEAAQGILDGPITGKESGYLPGLEKRRKEEARLFLLPKNSEIKYT